MTSITTNFNDQPIALPSEDRFGIEPFAQALAGSLLRIRAPEGTVIAVNGPWGSGKSSAVNLIRHYLAASVEAKDVVMMDFACWWFRGEDALATAFFRELYAGMSPSLGAKVRDALPKLGARLLRVGSVAGVVADAAGASGAGKVVGSAAEKVADFIAQDESVEKLHKKLCKALSKQDKRFVIFIDDIDRLSPEEALLIFRLVKSVGRLPNVMYLLAYDRLLAERIVSDAYPSEGPHYLEKIVQAAFDIPEPSEADMRDHLMSVIDTLVHVGAESDRVRLMNIFYEWLVPSMRTPRDVARLGSALAVTWPVVAGDVDRADFLALEVLRLLHPSIYRALRRNEHLLCGATSAYGQDRAARARACNAALFGAEEPEVHERVRRVLARLFPVLESVWQNRGYSDSAAAGWAAGRRVCSSSHFNAYFRFSISDDVLPRVDFESFLSHAGSEEYVASVLRDAVKQHRRSGGTKAAVLLDELRIHSRQIIPEHVRPLLRGIFSVADDINVDADRAGALSFADNQLRIHWLVRALTLEQMTLEQRSALLVETSERAQLGWLDDFTSSAWHSYHPAEGTPARSTDECLTTEDDATRLRAMLLMRIEQAVTSSTLAQRPELLRLLFSWRELAGGDGAAPREWLEAMQDTEDGLRRLAAAFTSHGWSQVFGGMGDAVATRTTIAQVRGLERLLDVDVFRARLDAVNDPELTPEIAEFLAAWDRGGRE